MKILKFPSWNFFTKLCVILNVKSNLPELFSFTIESNWLSLQSPSYTSLQYIFQPQVRFTFNYPQKLNKETWYHKIAPRWSFGLVHRCNWYRLPSIELYCNKKYVHVNSVAKHRTSYIIPFGNIRTTKQEKNYPFAEIW